MSSFTSLGLSLQKFSIHDGPGIRTTVFFKGCPLRCAWCHNPESQSYASELLFDAEKCNRCGRCIPHCPHQAIPANPGEPIDRNRCNACGKCVDYCLNNARKIAGKLFSISDTLKEIMQDHIFYEQSGGGVTFSGGEPMTHIDVLEPLAAECNLRGLHVTVDTCGFASPDAFHRILPHANLFLFDLKHMDPEQHRIHTGQDNQLIFNNLRMLSESGAAIFLRVPLIEGINADEANMSATLAFAQTLRLIQINLLPYHDTGHSKYARLGQTPPLPSLQAPSPIQVEKIQRRFAAAGFTTYIGG
jgi:pyruvate formate lyase activating enzyme